MRKPNWKHHKFWMPATSRIVAERHLDESWSDRLGAMSISKEKENESTSGDQWRR